MSDLEQVGWYVIGAQEDLGASKMLSGRLFGRRVVCFEAAEGRIAALEDRCVHRSVPLSLGTVRDGRLVCPAHGWHFDASGACRLVPSCLPNEAIAGTATVATLPCASHAGYVWLWSGDRAPTALPRAFEIPELKTPGFQVLKLKYRVPCAVDDALSNLIDITHVPFVHLFPDMNPRDRRLAVSLVEIRTQRDRVVLRAGRPSEVGSTAGPITDQRVEIQFAAPTSVRLEFARPAEGQARALVACFRPEDPSNTVVEAAIVFPGSDSRDLTKTIRLDVSDSEEAPSLGKILDEDLRILCGQSRARNAAPHSDMHVAGDAMIAACKRHVRERFGTSGESMPRTKRLLCRCGVDVPNWPMS